MGSFATCYVEVQILVQYIIVDSTVAVNARWMDSQVIEFQLTLHLQFPVGDLFRSSCMGITWQ
jgi:hypothetical protein